MKIKELMINDWVLSPETDTPFRIQSISGAAQEHLHTATAKNAAGEFLARGVWNPIPLTGEILQRNGFVYLPAEVTLFGATEHLDDAYVLQVEDRQITIQGYSDFLYRVTFSNTANNLGWFDMGAFRHVHELQHALRVCGFCDIADNFKI